MDEVSDQAGEDDFDGPSKSALKREMTARQALGEALCELSPKQLARIPIDSADLLEAIEEARKIRTHSALRRHRQFIGKLMRQIDTAPIQAALDEIHQSKRDEATRFQRLEVLRDRVIRDGDAAITELLTRYPEADRQLLRQLMRQARQEADKGKAPSASRRLFRYLRDLQESH